MKRKFFTLGFIVVAAFSFAQTKTTGTVSMGSMTFKIDLDEATSTVTYTLTGPSTKWLAVGLNATTMSTNTPIDCISYGTSLLDRYLHGGHNSPTTDPTDNLTLVSNTVSGNTRTIVATRPFNTGDSHDYTFSYSITSLHVIWAIGPSTNTGSQHSSYGTKLLNFTEVLGTNDIAPTLDKIALYPVPAKNLIDISNSAKLQITTIRVFDTNAKLLKEFSVNSYDALITVDISGLESGIYYMELSGETGKTVKKFEIAQ